MNDVTMMVLKVIISICVVLFTTYGLPYLKSLREDARYASIFDIIEIAVRAAEQTIKGSGQGSLKKAEVVGFVTDWMTRRGIKIREEELDQLIEAAVYAMKQEG